MQMWQTGTVISKATEKSCKIYTHFFILKKANLQVYKFVQFAFIFIFATFLTLKNPPMFDQQNLLWQQQAAHVYN